MLSCWWLWIAAALQSSYNKLSRWWNSRTPYCSNLLSSEPHITHSPLSLLLPTTVDMSQLSFALIRIYAHPTPTLLSGLQCWRPGHRFGQASAPRPPQQHGPRGVHREPDTEPVPREREELPPTEHTVQMRSVLHARVLYIHTHRVVYTKWSIHSLRCYLHTLSIGWWIYFVVIVMVILSSLRWRYHISWPMTCVLPSPRWTAIRDLDSKFNFN